jgi:hypothetical protein
LHGYAPTTSGSSLSGLGYAALEWSLKTKLAWPQFRAVPP